MADASRLDRPVGQRPNAHASAVTGVPGPVTVSRTVSVELAGSRSAVG